MKTCPYCESEIANNAKKCKYCGEIVVEEKEVRLCPYCEAEVSDTAKKCKHCGEWIIESGKQKEKDRFIVDSSFNEVVDINEKHAGRFISILSQGIDFFLNCTLIFWIYNFISFLLFGTTIGNNLCGIILKDKSGIRLTTKQRLISLVTYLPISLPLSGILIDLGYFLHKTYGTGFISIFVLILLLFGGLFFLIGIINFIIGIFSQKYTIDGFCGVRKIIRISYFGDKIMKFASSMGLMGLIIIVLQTEFKTGADFGILSEDFVRFFMRNHDTIFAIFISIFVIGTIIGLIITKSSNNHMEYKESKEFKVAVWKKIVLFIVSLIISSIFLNVSIKARNELFYKSFQSNLNNEAEEVIIDDEAVVDGIIE